MDTTTKFIIFAVVLVVGLITLTVLYFYYKYKAAKKLIPNEILRDFEESERRYKKARENGKPVTGEQILYELAVNRPADTVIDSGEPAIEVAAVQAVSSEKPGDIQDGDIGTNDESESTADVNSSEHGESKNAEQFISEPREGRSAGNNDRKKALVHEKKKAYMREYMRRRKEKRKLEADNEL